MAQDFAAPFYNSPAWKKCRKAYAKSVRNLCERCLAKGIYRPGVIVHHKVWLTPENITDQNITLSWGNLELLCRDCHAEVHEGMERRRTFNRHGRKYRYKVEKDGTIAPLY